MSSILVVRGGLKITWLGHGDKDGHQEGFAPKKTPYLGTVKARLPTEPPCCHPRNRPQSQRTLGSSPEDISGLLTSARAQMPSNIPFVEWKFQIIRRVGTCTQAAEILCSNIR